MEGFTSTTPTASCALIHLRQFHPGLGADCLSGEVPTGPRPSDRLRGLHQLDAPLDGAWEGIAGRLDALDA
jgi:hypothetical protein